MLSLCLLCPCFSSTGQVITSVQDGAWNVTSTWSSGTIPESTNSTSIVIDHQVSIPAGFSIAVDEVTINGELQVARDAWVEITSGNGIVLASGTLVVEGTILCQDGASLAGTTAINTNFLDGSRYVHMSVNEGVVPQATWHPNSTFELRGLTGNRTLSSANWSQAFGNFHYECPAQGDFVEFGGRLRNIRGDLVVANTNNNVLRLGTSQTFSLNVAGNLRITGPSQVWFNSTGVTALDVGGNFLFESTTTASSYLTTTGNSEVVVRGDLVFASTYKLKMASSTNNGHSDLRLEGDFYFTSGTLDALGSGSGTIIFSGVAEQFFVRESGVFDGSLSFVVDEGSVLSLGENILSNTSSGTFTLNGRVRLGSLDPMGALQYPGGGNVQTVGGIIFGTGAVVEYNADQRQYLGTGHTLTPVHVHINNPEGVVMRPDLCMMNDLLITRGVLDVSGKNLLLTGDLLVTATNQLLNTGQFRCAGTTPQSLNVMGAGVQGLTISNPAGVTLTSEILIRGNVMLDPGSQLSTNDFLTLLSSNESTSHITRLASGASIEGDVTLMRHMPALGRSYRYLSSPVATATVADLMDDFPITGEFDGASSGPGLSANPSFFLYDESSGGTNSAGWYAYPDPESNSAAPLAPGQGYAAFIREAGEAVTWDVTGPVNQGDMQLPVTYTDTGNPDEDGWNLVGNPYPAPIRWAEGEGLELSGVSTSIAVRDHSIQGFRYWDGEVGDLPNGVIAMGQAFWVKAIAPDPVVRLTEECKYNGEAVFLRSAPVDHLILEVKVDSITDRAYLRTHPDAVDGVDHFDLPKMANDFLNISFLNNKRDLAIDAVNASSCRHRTVVRITTASKTSGPISLRVKTIGAFQQADIILVDSLTGRRYEVDEEIVLETNNRDTFVLSLTVTAGSPDTFSIPSGYQLCGADSLAIDIPGTQTMTLGLRTESGDWISPEKNEPQQIVFEGAHFTEGVNRLQLVSRSACMETVVGVVTVDRKIPLTPAVSDLSRCGPGEVIFHASKQDHDGVRWYEEETSEVPVWTRETFITPLLKKDKTYFCATLKGNCESDRREVRAHIMYVDPVTLEYDSGYIISSSSGNQWWVNDEERVGEEGKSLRVEGAGVYEAIVYQGACYASARMVITGEEQSEPMLVAYPNPVTDHLCVPIVSPEKCILHDILDSAGKSVLGQCKTGHESCALSIFTDELPAGIYVVVLSAGKRRQVIRFLKK